MSPTERTLKWLRKQGYTCEVVEKRIPSAASDKCQRCGHREGSVLKDLFGVIDIVAMKPGNLGVLGVQVTSAAHLSDRCRKVREEPRSAMWRACGNWLWVIGWAKRGAAGKRKLWEPSVVMLGEEGSFVAVVPVTFSREATVESVTIPA